MTEVTLQLTPLRYLREEMKVMTSSEIRSGHAQRLSTCLHLKHHFIPYTDSVIVYMHEEITKEEHDQEKERLEKKDKLDERKVKRALLELNYELRERKESLESFVRENKSRSFAQLREDALKAGDPLDPSHVRRVNVAELDFWEQSQGRRVGTSQELLMFECGGSQVEKEEGWIY